MDILPNFLIWKEGLSPYLFLLSVEVLGYAIRSNEQIKGIKLGDEICKLI